MKESHFKQLGTLVPSQQNMYMHIKIRNREFLKCSKLLPKRLFIGLGNITQQSDVWRNLIEIVANGFCFLFISVQIKVVYSPMYNKCQSTRGWFLDNECGFQLLIAKFGLQNQTSETEFSEALITYFSWKCLE